MNENIALALATFSLGLFGLSLWLLHQRHLRLGLAFGFVGLAVATFSNVWQTYLKPRVATLQDTIKGLEDTVSKKQLEVTRLNEKNTKLDGANASLRANTSSQIHQWTSGVNGVETAFGDLTTELQKRGFQLTPGNPSSGEAPKDLSKLSRLAGAIVDITHHLRSGPKVRPGVSASEMRESMRSGITTYFYETELMPESELVADQIGSYTLVHLKDPTTGRRFIFPKREYELKNFQQTIRASAALFKIQILEVLEASGTVKIYVRGGADARALEGADIVAPFKEISSALLLGDDDKYVKEVTNADVNNPIKNSDLPNLRANFFRSVISKELGQRKFVILSNGPSTSVEDNVRAVDLILFVSEKSSEIEAK